MKSEQTVKSPGGLKRTGTSGGADRPAFFPAACSDEPGRGSRMVPRSLASGSDLAALRDEVDRLAAPLTLAVLLWLGGWRELS